MQSTKASWPKCRRTMAEGDEAEKKGNQLAHRRLEIPNRSFPVHNQLNRSSTYQCASVYCKSS